jgi:hypothetical protein
MTNTKTLRSRMKGKLSCPVLKTSGAGDSLAEFNYAAAFDRLRKLRTMGNAVKVLHCTESIL